MMCKIEGCRHRVLKTATPSRHVGQSWYDFGICSCCAMELFPEKGYRVSQRCNRVITEEQLENKRILQVESIRSQH